MSALSHELEEAIDDPFIGSDGVHNLTPWWLDSRGVCQNKNEVADAVQSLPGALLSVTTVGMTYHPQNVALSQWFQTGIASDAIDGAFSYPDQTLLTSPTPLRNPLCQ